MLCWSLPLSLGRKSKTSPKTQNWKKVEASGRWLWSTLELRLSFFKVWTSLVLPWCSSSLSLECIFRSFIFLEWTVFGLWFIPIYNFHFLCWCCFSWNTRGEKRVRVEWVKTFEYVWILLKGMLYKIIMFLRSAPSGVLCWVLLPSHLIYYSRRRCISHMAWMAPTWWCTWKIEDQCSPFREKSLLPGAQVLLISLASLL